MPGMDRSKLHIAIVGAGLGGLAAAIAITQAGHRVTILEQAPELAEIGAGIQIPPNSSRLLRRWGLLERIKAHSVVPRGITFRSYRDGEVLSKQEYVPMCEEVYGASYLHIHRADFHREMVARAKELGVSIRLGCAVETVDFDTPAVVLKSGTRIEADLVIGADGLKSVCREALLNKPDPPRVTGDLVYRVIIRAEDMKKHPELVEFVEKPRINLWVGPDSHVVCYLLKGGDLYNVVLSAPDNLPELVNTAKADLAEMRAFFASWDARMRKMLDIVQDTSKWRLLNSEEMSAWSRGGRFSLMGDACHATLPYIAQGAAQAIEDGAALGALFEGITAPEQLPDLLSLYESVRKARTTRVVTKSTAMRAVWQMHDGLDQQQRDHQLRTMEPYEHFPNPWADPVLQKYLFSYDAYEEGKRAWKEAFNVRESERR